MAEDTKKMKKQKLQGFLSLSTQHPLSRLTPPIELTDFAKEIEKADLLVNNRISAQLKVIADQIRHLQSEAKVILQAARTDQELHRARCGFKKIPGNIYHLYQDKEGNHYFSMLSPADWQDNPPHRFIGSYRLEVDLSWTSQEQNSPSDK